MVRVSAAFGVVLMVIYRFAHMNWPFIENTNNFIVDYHLVYAGVLVTLIVTRAGHVFGLDAWAEHLRFVKEHPVLKPLVPAERLLERRKGPARAFFVSVSACGRHEPPIQISN